MKRADGAVRNVEARYRKPAGGVTDTVVQVGVLRDITDRVELNERLERQMAERRATEQALFDAERLTTVGEMAATLAHEITQPLQVINVACASASDELSQGAESGAGVDREFLKARIARISQQVERASRIVGDLRSFVRGTASEEAAPFDPAQAVRSAVDLTGHGVRQARGSINASVADGLPAILGHASKLEQVLVNLINNARDAGAPSIFVTATPQARDGRRFVRLAVEDTGPGIAPEILPRLFLSFVTTKPRGTGTGLGLRICKRIVEEMGGTISVANRAEGGACFEIVLPAAAVAA
jgi:signal transduction histidine kinase